MTLELNASAVMQAGYKRIKSIADRHGINSAETLAACERWGGILDDINYPDSTCRWCGNGVTYESRLEHYVHQGTGLTKCWDNAPAEATAVKS